MPRGSPTVLWPNALSQRSPYIGNVRVGQCPSFVTWTRFGAWMVCSDFFEYSPTSCRDGLADSYLAWFLCRVSELSVRLSQPARRHHFRSSQACGSSIPNRSRHRDEARIPLASSTPLLNASQQRWRLCESRVRCSAPLRCNLRRMQRVRCDVCRTCFDSGL